MKYYVGIDLGGTFIKCGIVAEDGTLILKDKVPTSKKKSEIIADMSELAKALATRAGVELAGAGIGSPGTIDSANGVIVYSNNIAWENIPLAEAVAKGIGVPVFVTNDANAAALGEQFCGAGKAYQNVVLVTLGTGVGGGIVIDGKLFEGNRSAGAEIGHTVISMGGEKCTCGRKGCFEAYASATALIRQTQRAMQKNKTSKLWAICGNDADMVCGKTAFDGMREGDETATEVVDGYIEYLSEGIANLCNEFRPEAVLLGGGVCAEGDTLLVPLKRLVDEKIYGGTQYAPVEILRASLGNDAGVYGAARYCMLRMQ